MGRATKLAFRVETATDEMRQEFQKAIPFPHVILNLVLDEVTLSEAENALGTMPMSNWLAHRDPTSGEMEQQKRKIGLKDPSALPPRARDVMNFSSSPEICRFFEDFTGIPDLQPDPRFLGGRVHNTQWGRKLSIHADFNLHRQTGKHRPCQRSLISKQRWEGGPCGCARTVGQGGAEMRQVSGTHLYSTDGLPYH